MITYMLLTEKGTVARCVKLKSENDGEPLILFLGTYLLEIFTCVYRHITKEVHWSTVC